MATDHYQFCKHAAADGRTTIFASPDQGIDWSLIAAATLMTSAPCQQLSCCSSGNSFRAL